MRFFFSVFLVILMVCLFWGFWGECVGVDFVVVEKVFRVFEIEFEVWIVKKGLIWDGIFKGIWLKKVWILFFVFFFWWIFFGRKIVEGIDGLECYFKDIIEWSWIKKFFEDFFWVMEEIWWEGFKGC